MCSMFLRKRSSKAIKLTKSLDVMAVHLKLIHIWGQTNSRWPPKHKNGYNRRGCTDIELGFQNIS